MAASRSSTLTAPATELARLNVADRLHQFALCMPDAIAIACPHQSSPGYPARRQPASGSHYATTTFAELDADATRLAQGFIAWGVPPGTRLALLVRPGIEFVTLVFALLRAGMVIVLVDPGSGRRNLVRCLSEAEPEGFIAIPVAQAVRLWMKRRFPRAKWNVTVGRRWFWGGLTLDQLRARGDGVHRSATSSLPAPSPMLPATAADDPAAIIFTSGSTGAPKGVLYTHQMFDTQVAAIQSAYSIEPGGIDLGCFPLFALFNSAMGVTTVFPEMDFSRPANADPNRLLAAANDWQVTQAFASPAVWHLVSEHWARSGVRMDSLRQVFSCGAPVPANVIQQTLACIAHGAKMHTPYGATECLPVATIEAAEVLNETAVRTNEGAGVCVGRKFDSIEWRVIRITDEPIGAIEEAEELPPGEIGELIVRGPQASPCYITRPEANADAKIADGGLRIADSGSQSALRNPQSEIVTWHRMGDVGYLDEHGRFWYCGRKSQRVESRDGTLYTEVVEAIINRHPHVERSALVGIGVRSSQTPVVVVETTLELYEIGDTWWSHPAYLQLIQELKSLAKQHAETKHIANFLLHIHLPTDIRHNAKINREMLACWATEELPELAICTHS